MKDILKKILPLILAGVLFFCLFVVFPAVMIKSFSEQPIKYVPTTVISNPYNYRATIKRVIDGDTIEADIDVGFDLTISKRLRLLRINTPELTSSDPTERNKAKEAKQFLESQILGKTVMIHTEKDDSFGRYLAEVEFEGKNINDVLLATGRAVPYTK